ncbi:hypothetical protein OG741_34720 [Streptomyces sp. NBC_01410]|uniref:hypothetical protein n=1 Tax=Streptomyces sp. NBC_01410 TaxID=2903856 RepID=UPI003244EF0C
MSTKLRHGAKLHVTESLTELRKKIAGHLAKAMPRPIAADDLAVRTAADPSTSVLEGVSMFLHREPRHRCSASAR